MPEGRATLLALWARRGAGRGAIRIASCRRADGGDVGEAIGVRHARELAPCPTAKPMAHDPLHGAAMAFAIVMQRAWIVSTANGRSTSASDEVEPMPLRLPCSEIFIRAFRHAEFDICKRSPSSFGVETARGRARLPSPYRHLSHHAHPGRLARPGGTTRLAAGHSGGGVLRSQASLRGASCGHVGRHGVMPPFVKEVLAAAKAVMGEDC